MILAHLFDSNWMFKISRMLSLISRQYLYSQKGQRLTVLLQDPSITGYQGPVARKWVNFNSELMVNSELIWLTLG